MMSCATPERVSLRASLLQWRQLLTKVRASPASPNYSSTDQLKLLPGKPFRKQLQHRPLALQDSLPRFIEAEPFRAVDLRNFHLAPRPWRPFNRA